MTVAPRPNDSVAPPPALESLTAGHALPPPPGLRVLCVDDNEDAADSLGTLLGMVGCDVAVSNNAADALARADAFRPQAFVLEPIRLTPASDASLCGRRAFRVNRIGS